MATRRGNDRSRQTDPGDGQELATTPELDAGTYRIEFTASSSTPTEIAYVLVRRGQERVLQQLFVQYGLNSWKFTAEVAQGDVFKIIHKASGLRFVNASIVWQSTGLAGGL